jgi:transposase
VRRIVDLALANMSGLFDSLYAGSGRPSIPPEQLIRALLLQFFDSVRSERQLMERIDFDLCFRWFVGLDIDDTVWHPTTFTKNRDRLLTASITQRLFAEVKAQAQSKKLLSKKHLRGRQIARCQRLVATVRASGS